MTPDLDVLLERCGRYGGHGIDHEDRPFYGELDLQPLPAGQGVWLSYRRSGIDGSLLHDERSWVALDPEGRLCLWTVNTRLPGVRSHPQRRGVGPAGVDATLVFGTGDPGDLGLHRVEIAIDLWPEDEVGYRTSWGVPEGEFRPRSQVRMEREP